MKQITSRDNPFFKELLKLAGSARHRQKAKLTLLDGIHLLEAYFATGQMPQHLMVTESGLKNNAHSTLLKKILTIPITQFPITHLPDNLFNELSELKTLSGILALIDIPRPVFTITDSQFCLLLEDIQDPGNLGSILRSAAGAGCDAVYLSKNCADGWSPKVLRAAMGGHFSLDIYEAADLLHVVETFPGKTFATSPHAKINLYQADLRGKIAFAIGNEGAGLSQDLLATAHQLVFIPMSKNFKHSTVESLNVAAATAVCVFEAARQRNE